MGVGDPLEAVDFLATSANRVQALEALTIEPHDRHELEDRIGVSRVTAKRILDGFEARGWARPDGQRCRTTPLGEVIATEFRALLDTIETMRKLSTVRQWLSIEEFDFDLRRFSSARVTLTTWSDSAAPLRRCAEVIRESSRIRVAGSGVAPDVIRGLRNVAVSEAGHVELILTTDALTVGMADASMAMWLRETVEAGAETYRHDEGFEYLIATCDERAVIGMNDEAGAPRGLVESEDETIYEWVDATIERCRHEAEPVVLDTLRA